MATPNRGERITKLLSQVKKLYKPAAAPPARSLFEHMLFACVLENSPYEAAEQVFQTLKADYFDWNEVRVSTRRELSEVMKPLTDPEQAADRLKRTLHNVFEKVYAFDLEPLKKQNLGVATKTLEGYEGTTPFVVAYCTQHALGGHAIPVNQGLMTALVTLDVISAAEAAKGIVPGLERTIPKAKGHEVGSQLHQLGVEVGKNPYGQNARKVLLSLDPECKDRLPKKPAEPAPVPVPPPPKPTPPAAPATKESKAKSAELKSDPKVEAKVDPKVKGDKVAKPESKDKPEAKPAAKPVDKGPAKPATKAEAKPAAKKPEPKPPATPAKPTKSTAKSTAKPPTKDAEKKPAEKPEKKVVKKSPPTNKPKVTNRAEPVKKKTASKQLSKKKPR